MSTQIEKKLKFLKYIKTIRDQEIRNDILCNFVYDFGDNDEILDFISKDDEIIEALKDYSKFCSDRKEKVNFNKIDK